MTPAEAVVQFTPFVHKVARRYARLGLVEYDDLVQEGLAAVAKAAETYTPKAGAAFLTYIHRPIRWAMQKAIDTAGGLSGRGRDERGFKRFGPMIVSLDEPHRVRQERGEPDERSLHETLGTFDDPADSVDEHQAAGLLPELLERLTPRERQVLRERFERGRTLADVGEDFGLSRERVRQIEAEALGKLRVMFARKGIKHV